MKNEYLFIFQKNKNIHFHPHDGEIGEFHFVHTQCVQRYSNSIIRKTIPHMMMMRKKFTLKNCMLMIIEYFFVFIFKIQKWIFNSSFLLDDDERNSGFGISHRQLFRFEREQNLFIFQPPPVSMSFHDMIIKYNLPSSLFC